MDIVLAIVFTAFICLLGFSAFIYTKLVNIERQLKAIRGLIAKHDDNITKKLMVPNPQSSPEPNEAAQQEEEVVPLDEQSPWHIPRDVKIEVEGGDSLAPLEYEVANA